MENKNDLPRRILQGLKRTWNRIQERRIEAVEKYIGLKARVAAMQYGTPIYDEADVKQEGYILDQNIQITTKDSYRGVSTDTRRKTRSSATVRLPNGQKVYNDTLKGDKTRQLDELSVTTGKPFDRIYNPDSVDLYIPERYKDVDWEHEIDKLVDEEQIRTATVNTVRRYKEELDNRWGL